jgi:hypothetical protein
MEALAKRPWLLRGAVLGLALVVGVVAWIAGGDDEQVGEGDPPTVVGTRIVEPAELTNVAATLGYPVYWAGPMAGAVLELTESEDGSVQLRYLEDAAEAGSESASVLAIGSYPLPDPAAALDRFAAEPGSVVRRSRAGLEVMTNEGNPTSAYFASPDNGVQVEVYDPRPRRALSLALSGRVRPAD